MKVLAAFLSLVLALYGCGGGGGGGGRISRTPMFVPDEHDYHSTIVILPSEGLPYPFYHEGTVSGGLYTHFSISELPIRIHPTPGISPFIMTTREPSACS